MGLRIDAIDEIAGGGIEPELPGQVDGIAGAGMPCEYGPSAAGACFEWMASFGMVFRFLDNGKGGAPNLRPRPDWAILSVRRGRSSAGRAPRSQCGGREFDPPRLHQCFTKALSDQGLFFFGRREVRSGPSKWSIRGFPAPCPVPLSIPSRHLLFSRGRAEHLRSAHPKLPNELKASLKCSNRRVATTLARQFYLGWSEAKTILENAVEEIRLSGFALIERPHCREIHTTPANPRRCRILSQL